MVKLIIADKNETLYFEKDGVLSDNRKDAKVFTSEKEAEKKSIELQLMDCPVKWVFIA